MKSKADVYLKAAELVEDDCEPYSCMAIKAALLESGWKLHYNFPEIIQYTDLFIPRPNSHNSFLAQLLEEYGYSFDDIKQWRITALCFAAAMAETGDL